ncbi:MAG: AIM24 family protein, partial [Verrucomicrobiaceae bacterium]
MSSFTQINSKLLQVQLSGGDVLCRNGTMIAYTGEIEFSRSFLGPGGLQAAAARAATGEGITLMHARGSGQVLFADDGGHVTIIPLSGDTLYVESSSLLAFTSSLNTSIVFQGNQGASGVARGLMSGQGLFSTALQGNGDVAIVSEGDVIGLPVTHDKPVFVDPQAYIGYKGSLSSEIVTAMGWK